MHGVRRTDKRKWRRCFALAAATIASLDGIAVAGEAAAKPYLLGSGDELRIKVYEWRPSLGDVHEWKILNADYKVGPAGTISVPLLGEIPVEGSTSEAVASTLSERLKEKVGLTGQPETAVEIIGFRPIFVVGAVNKPGEYAYRPNQIVLQAVAIAGGLLRDSDQGLLELDRGQIAVSGTWQATVEQRNRLLAQAARIQAELDGKDTIVLPEELRHSLTPSRLAGLAGEQEAVAKAHNTTFRAKIENHKVQRDLLVKEVAALEAKTAATNEELTMVQRELQSTSSLVKQGLVVSPREFSLRQTDLEIQARRLDLDTAMLHARQQIARNDEDVTDLQNERHEELLRLQQEAMAELAQLAEKIHTQVRTLQHYDFSRTYLTAKDNDGPRRPIYTVFRRTGLQARNEPADETTVLDPGDTLRVVYPNEPLPAINDSAASLTPERTAPVSGSFSAANQESK